ncbi:MAG: alpha/beta hydrolase [Syntrophobacteraceae bacterium]
MKKLAHFSMITLVVIVLMGLGLLSAPANATHQMHPSFRPMIFVHGLTGSAAQFEWQAMRFTSNGYPQNYLNAYEYDSVRFLTDPTYPAQVFAQIDQLIATILKETGANKLDLLGHSLGTFVLVAYLNSSSARAANVAHYVSFDGTGATSLPGGVPTLAIWAGLDPPGFGPPGNPRNITGATNVTIPNILHNESASGPLSFAQVYPFLTGQNPKSTDVLPQFQGDINLAGRALLYPQNVGVAGSTVEIYELCGETGARKHNNPEAIYPIDASGNFGPFNAEAGAYYELNIARPGENHHFYIEPRIRSDYFIRLNTSPVGQGLGALLTMNPDQTNLIITRNREFLGDQNDGYDDILAINGINIVNGTNAFPLQMTVAYFTCDWGSDQITNLTPPIPVPALNTTFLSAVDLYLHGATPPDATISIVVTPRGDCGSMQRINVPNWAIINEAGTFVDAISVILDDYIPSRCNQTWQTWNMSD